MNVLLPILLIVNAAFNFFTWPQFLRRVAKDTRARDAAGKATAFLKVHIVLVTIAEVLAVVSLVVAILALAGVL